MSLDTAALTDAELLDALGRLASQNKLLTYDPYPWQREFHDAGDYATERMLICANGVGKSLAVGAETAMHATGQYPKWWKGLRFPRGGFEIWVGSIDNNMQKIGQQRILLGRDIGAALGTGMIPASAIEGIEIRQAGVKEVVDTIRVTHAAGDTVNVVFKTYEQGWRKWQSGDPKLIVFDEEPDENNNDQKDVFDEARVRLIRNSGHFMVGYTPLLGETRMTRHFMHPKAGGIWWTGATWDDAPHMSEEDKERHRATYPAHQLEARTKGIPMMGEGRIFTTSENAFAIDPLPIPDYWARVTGIDLGMAHPAAVAALAWDRDADVVYLYDCWRETNARTADHAYAIKSRGDWIPVAWPHDGEQRDPKSGERFADIYRREHGCNMLSKSARYKNNKGGGQAVWPVIEDMRLRLQSGRFKVFRTCKPWLEEYRSYHTKDGKIVAIREDTLKASFYALMMLRYAVAKSSAHGLSRRTMQPAAFTSRPSA